MGILESDEIKAALSVQEHLDNLEQAIRLAAGVRQMLGSLLIQAGKISAEQLDYAIAEQQKRGGKLGVVCMSLGFISERQLDGLLEFQKHQCLKPQHVSPLRLGELLISVGHISREQLDDALHKQTHSHKKLGEVLIDEGYAHPSQIIHGMHLQHLLMTAALAAVLSLTTLPMTGCGSGGGNNITESAVVSSVGVETLPITGEFSTNDLFTMTSNDYSLIKPNFYYSTDNASFWSIQANVAKGVTDINSVCVFRIDISKNGNSMPDLNKTFSIEDGTQFEMFPGSFLVFNGKKSVNKKVESGTISFSPDSVSSRNVTGTFEVTLTDYDSDVVPAPQYHLKGSFNFVMGTYNPEVLGST